MTKNKISKLIKKIKVKKIDSIATRSARVFSLDTTSTKKEILVTLDNVSESKQFKKIDKKLKRNKKFLIEILKKNGKVFKYLDKDLRDNKELVLAALYHEPLVLKGFGPHMIWRNISKRLREDRDIVYEAVCHNRLINYYASEDMINDRKFVLKCAKGNGDILRIFR